MMPYTPGGGGGTTGIQNLSWEQQKEGAAMVASGLATAGVGELIAGGAWLVRGVWVGRATPQTLKGSQIPKVAAASARGRLMHKLWNYGPGFRKEFRLDSGKKADAVNLRERIVVELKPNNPKAIARGEKQVESYRR